MPEDVILVLDDYHTIHSSEIHALLDFLIEHLPLQLHLVLATSFDPPLPLARWRARGHLTELRGADLRFTLQETQAFLARVLGNEAAYETAMALEERTEGWIAMMRLAALSLRHTSDAASFMQQLRHAPDRNMSSYLVEEVLDQLTPAVQELLVRTSILDQFCAELCAVVMGSDASYEQVQTTLDWLEDSNLFLVSLDERQGWYRFHHLFQQLLQQRLQARIQIQGSPTLLVARAWILQARGQFKDYLPVLRAAERLVGPGDSGASDTDDRQSRILRALMAILWSQFQYLTGQAQASLESAQSALRWLPPDVAYIASYSLFYLALSQQATGQEEVALETLNQALREHQAQLNSTARLLLAQTYVYLTAGKLQQVEHTARHLLRLAQEADLALSQFWAHWGLGYVHYEWNHLDEAVYHFSVVVANRHRANLWAVQRAMGGLAFAYQAQGLGAQAQETARTLLAWVQEQHNMRDLMLAYAYQGLLALLQDEVEEAEQWVEMAGEQEVHGPPMMSFEDPPLTKAWMLLAKGNEQSVAHGQALLADLLQEVASVHDTRKTIQVLALQALASNLQGRMPEALAVLERALALARPGGFLRTFADLPPLVKVLQELRKRRKTHLTVDKKLDTYLQRILVAMSPPASQAVSKEKLLQQEGIEPLTDRELHILRLLDKDLTNKEIARELVVTPGTVKVHTTNVYRKLSVNNRRAAVTLAKALGLLAAS
ncbi:MAG: hypothetical protein E6I97_22615 [Chloroflexi bacterium]|nr:MAG: hypothetical protein E6I97_22615 [Chloroflexota bacterium]